MKSISNSEFFTIRIRVMKFEDFLFSFAFCGSAVDAFRAVDFSDLCSIYFCIFLMAFFDCLYILLRIFLFPFQIIFVYLFFVFDVVFFSTHSITCFTPYEKTVFCLTVLVKLRQFFLYFTFGTNLTHMT